MSSLPMIAIDPGKSGGIAWVDERGMVDSMKMPDGMTSIADELIDLAAMLSGGKMPPLCWIEKVGTYMPGNSGPAAATFARHCGHLEAITYCIDLPTQQVTPNGWMKGMGLPTGKANKKARKDKVKEMMQRRYPHLKVTLYVADALGILSWALDRGES